MLLSLMTLYQRNAKGGQIMRRENNTGTVYKLSGKRRNPWIARICIGYDEGGNRKWQTIGYFRTKAEGSMALAKYAISPTSPKANIKFSELFKEWKSVYYGNISKQLADNYNASYEHLKLLHNMKFNDIRTAHMQNIIDGITVQNKSEKKAGCPPHPASKSTKQKAKILCGLLYKYAMQNDICHKNYAEFIRIEREEKKEKQIFSDLEIKVLFNNEVNPYAQMVLILIYTGLRIQELLNLTIFDVDLNAGIIHGGLKTDSGKNRIVPIHPKILSYMVSWCQDKDGAIFVREDGTLITQNYFRRSIYYPLLEKLGINRKTPHSTRHTCATLLARQGADTLAIQQILGHKDYAFTADTYTHTDIIHLKEAIARI